MTDEGRSLKSLFAALRAGLTLIRQKSKIFDTFPQGKALEGVNL